MVNACYFYPVKSIAARQVFRPGYRYRLVNSLPHFLNYKAYQFEGYDAEERENLDRLKLQIQVYEKLPDSERGYIR